MKHNRQKGQNCLQVALATLMGRTVEEVLAVLPGKPCIKEWLPTIRRFGYNIVWPLAQIAYVKHEGFDNPNGENLHAVVIYEQRVYDGHYARPTTLERYFSTRRGRRRVVLVELIPLKFDAAERR